MSDPFANLRPWQSPHVKHLLKVLLTNKAALDASDTGCHAKGTPILMFDGSVKNVEDVQIGDEIMGWDSTPRTVFGVTRGRGKMAKIIPVKGDPFVVNLDHILTLVQTNVHRSRPNFGSNGEVVDISVRKWLEWTAGKKHVFKLFRTPVVSWPEKGVPIEPYHLGVLLGDGCLVGKSALSICKPDKEIREVAKEIALLHGCKHVHRFPKDRCEVHSLQGGNLWACLQSLGLAGTHSGGRFVPAAYKTGSWNQRRRILAGLLDTDGSVTGINGFDYVSQSRRLSEDVVFLARSLGLAAYMSPTEKYCQTGGGGIYWRVGISGDTSILPLSIYRKQTPPRFQKKNVLRTGFRVELLPEDDFYGFTLDGDGRFLMGDFTVTHNTGKTYCALTIAKIMGVTPFVIGPKGAKNEWLDAAALLNHPVEFHHYDQVRQRKGPARDEDGERLPICNEWGEEVPWGTGSFWRWGIKPSFMVFDEVHKCGGSTSIQGKTLRSSTKAAEFVLCLSATAADNPKHLKNLGQVLGLFDGKHYYNWLMKNGCPPDYTGRPTFVDAPEEQAKYMAKIHAQIFPTRGARLRRHEIPGFPETLIDTRIYETDESIVEGGDNLAERTSQRQEAEKALVKCLLPDIEDALENDNKVVVFLNYRSPLDFAADIYSKQGWRVNLIDGRQIGDKGDVERKAIREAWKKAEYDVLLVNNQAGGAGLSLQSFFEITTFISPAETGRQMKQVVGRVHRDGGAFSRQYFCGIKGTIQEQILLTNRKKLQNIDTLNDAEAENIVFS